MTSATGLKRLYRTNATAKTLLDHYAGRDRNRTSTNFNRILNVLLDSGEPVTRARLRDVFRTMERLGFGTFIVGRRGHATRFLHTIPLIELGELAKMPANPRRVRARKRVVAKQRATNGRRKIAA